jgi:ABC-type transporter Mla MlaB component
MASKDDQPGLFSRMASFVLGGTKDKAASVLPDSVQDSTQESVYDKATLKAMIERKRHNDLIRKHEFDTLRKLRNSNVVTTASNARPSVFQASVPSDLEGRADTLKKIDEIEAQMSRQWWKGRQESGTKTAAAAPVASAPVRAASPAPAEKPAAPDVHFDKTVPYEHSAISTAVVLDGFRVTEALNLAVGRQAMPTVKEPEPVPVPVDTRVQDLGIDLDFGEAQPRFAVRHTHVPATAPAIVEPSKMAVFEPEMMQTDAELDEAAILYANGDAVGAEQSLLHALQTPEVAPQTGQAWFAALLDLFRATNNRAGFDAVVQQYPQYAKPTAPCWYATGKNVQPQDVSLHLDVAVEVPAEDAPASDALWECPADLTASALESLKQIIASHPQPWRLGWSRLMRIAPDAMPQLGVVMRKFCEEPVQLQFIGAERLVHLLAEMTPTMESAVAPAWWLVRLNVLRVVQLYDDFENTALDYCVTFEVSPPAWEPARCSYENVIGVHTAAVPAVSVAPMTPMPEIPSRVVPVVPEGAIELQGEILGDAMDALERAGHSHDEEAPVYRNDVTLEIYCSHLVRVDFSAAGSILNWAAMRQSEGCTVQFRDVNRMVAAFFHVIGINEHAQIIPTPMV